jgi:hypothetical protein
LSLPFFSVILEVAQQLLFLAIDRNDRVTLLLKLLAPFFDMGKLGIAILVRTSFNVLLIGP